MKFSIYLNRHVFVMIVQSVARLTADPASRKFESLLDHIPFVEIDHEIIFKFILPLPLIQEAQLSVTLVLSKLCGQVVVNHLEYKSAQEKLTDRHGMTITVSTGP